MKRSSMPVALPQDADELAAARVRRQARSRSAQPAGGLDPSADGNSSGDRLSALGREIHDTVLQDILYVGMGLDLLQHQLDGEGAEVGVVQQASHLQRMAAQAYERLRAIISGEQGGGLALVPVRDVLTGSVEEFNEKTSAGVAFEVYGGSRGHCLSGRTAREVDRIVTEALANAWRHGHADSIRVVLSETADIVWIRIVDDGRGFDASVKSAGHFGLRNMEERASAIQARLRVSSSPGEGTRVNLYLPCGHFWSSNSEEVSNDHSSARGR